ncbi:MerR family transcriptional regulator [Alphaproteobacteria bacterium GH1-50]|uniref:MerR family transcriptional regulator n=1 Tax=Kangsaoukella pontilimi TaxID=2691042 RepID=A0A7C9MGK9_9RHOB|nr:MerR family DNA-binding transcriptional regulator [Kangsaoukella pontilimi]MXQ09612.1 MerR family transcriptional regulator [Kangsaoukella pontilimi]
MTQDLMTIREMCDAFDVTPRTLRFYEAKELIFPVREGTRRLFTRTDRARLKLILRGKRFGFSLEQIRQLLDLYDRNNRNIPQVTKAIELGRERLDDMERQRDELEIAIKGLREQLSWGEEHLQTLINETAKAAE